MQITYEGIYPDSFVIDGVGKCLQEDYSYTSQKYPFRIGLRKPQLSYEYHREVTKSGKIITRLVKESLKFSGLDFQLIGTFPGDEEIPEQRFNQKLAESWLLSIARRINERIVKPRVLNLSKTFFQPYKNALLKNMSSEILDIMLEPNFGGVIDEIFKNNMDESKDIRSFRKFAFKNFEQFRNNCAAESASWLFRQAACPRDDLYMHTFNFMYDIRQQKNRSATYPSISWTSERIVRKDIPDDKRTQQFSSFHRQWILEFVLVTDKNGFLKMLNRVDVFFFFDPEIPTKVSTNLSRSVEMIIKSRLLGRFGKKK